MNEFKEYAEHGWLLVPILPGHKGPRKQGWNRKENCLTETNPTLRSAGLAHAYSGTCAIDIDDYAEAHAWLAEKGVDLDAIFNSPGAVQISSGRAGHGKLLYALDEPMCSKQIKVDKKCVIDFRCATAAGLTMQDVLPPSIHPDTAQPYKWVYGDDMLCDWRELPQLPKELYDVWFAEIDAPYTKDAVPEKGASTTELRDLLRQQDPNMSRDEWVRVGMAIHHETDGGVEGLDLWDEWSQQSAKYNGRRELEVTWRSFHDSANSVTVGLLRQDSVATPDEFPDIKDMPEDDPWEAAAEKRRERFKLTHVSEIAERDPPEWLVEGLVPKTGLAMMFGESSAGKSFVALDLAFSIASGFVWFNRKVEHGPVAWIAAEAAGSMRNRARAYAQARGVQLATTDLFVIEQTLSLMDKEDAKALTEVLATAKPKLIVVDTLAAASGGANENSGEDMNVVLANCRKIHEATGALILLIHHSGKDKSKGARGWSGLRAAMDSEFEVTNSDGSPIRVMEVTKQRDGSEGDRLPFKLLQVPLDFDDMSSCVVEPMDEMLLDNSEQRTLGGTQKTVFKAIYELANEMTGESMIVSIHDVYDAATIEMPAPPKGTRDRRGETIKRALVGLHEKGFITISNDKIDVGSNYDG